MAIVPELPSRLKLTDFRIGVLEEGLSRGLTYTLACKAATIDTTTLWNWMRTGKRVYEAYQEGDPPESGSLDELFYDLYVRLQQAEATAASAHLDLLNTAARNGSITASMWFLEHRHPDQYGRQVLDQVNYQGERESGPEPIRMVEILLPPE